jgi:hypothetical protein
MSAEECLRRRAEALRLRQLGWSYPAIARALKCSVSAAHGFVKNSPDEGRTPAPVRYHKNLPFGPEGLTWNDLQKRVAAKVARKTLTSDAGREEAVADSRAWATEARRRLIFDKLRRDSREFIGAHRSYAPWTAELLLQVMPALRAAGVTQADLVQQLLRWGCVRASDGGWELPSS